MTPERVQGTCVNIQDCPQIALILQNAPKPLPAGVQSYILNLRCGTVNGKVRFARELDETHNLT